MSTAVLIVGCVLMLCAAVVVYLWSRWADREAGYEPEPIPEEEANLYRLGIALGANQPGMRGGP